MKLFLVLMLTFFSFNTFSSGSVGGSSDSDSGSDAAQMLIDEEIEESKNEVIEAAKEEAVKEAKKEEVEQKVKEKK